MARIIKIKGKYYDTGTSNKSFLQVAKDLKTAGVKNWYFMLEIKDPYLVNVNPFAVDKDGKSTCTKDQVDRITAECIHNFWYYLREISRIPTAGIDGGIPYIANRGNIAQAWCLLHGIDSWLCLPRQQGKTKSALAAQSWAYSFGTANTKFIFVNKDGDNAKTNLRDFASIIECLPEFLRYEYVLDDDGKIVKEKKNATRMQHPVTNNEIVVKPKASSYEAAISLARGLTASIIHYDEPEFTPFIDVIVENSVSTFETAARRAKEAGAIYGRIFTCTPGDIDTDPGRRGEELLTKTVQWDESFYDKAIEEIEELIFADNKMGVVYIEYQYYQIGLTRDWFDNISHKIGNPLTVRREILLQRLRGSTASPYDRDDIDRIIDLAKRPIRHVLLNTYYRFDIYEEFNRSIPYLVGIDCSTGNGGDSNAMTVVNPYTENVVAEFECSYVGEPEFLACIEEMVKDYIPRAILCIERNHVGDAIIKFLLKGPFASRVYYDKHKEIAEENMKDLETKESILKAQAKLKTFYGVYTEGKSREAMFTILANRVKNHQEQFVGQNVTRDISKLVNKGGKIQAGQGWHDDSIMSYNICMYVLFYGNNLPIFGFDPADVMDVTLEKNSGMIDPTSINISNLGKSVNEFVEVEVRRHNQKNFSDMLQEEMMKRQEQTAKLARKGLISNTVYDDTPSDFRDRYGVEDEVDADLDFLDELNTVDTFSW